MTLLTGIIIAAHGRHYLAHTEAGRLQCVTRGKKSDVAVGDAVSIKQTSCDQGVIESIAERKTLLYRSDQYKSKLLAANVTQLFIVVATEPGFSDDLVSRALVAAEAGGIKAHILLNKIDMAELLPKARERIAVYAGLGYPVHEISIRQQAAAAQAMLTPLLANESTILIGQSGMGKSSLINALVPQAEAAVREISIALDSGKHTTTFTRLYQIDAHACVIDSPGFQEFGLYHLSEGMLERAFPEFAPYLGQCRFYNCHHVNEPGCAILEAVKSREVAQMRHMLYVQLRHESMQKIY